MAQHHKWDIASIENLYPYERDIYIEMLREAMGEENTHAVKPDMDMLQEVLKHKKTERPETKPDMTKLKETIFLKKDRR